MNNNALNVDELGGLYRDRAIRRFSGSDPNFFKKSNEEIFREYYEKFLVLDNMHEFGIDDMLSFLKKQERHVLEHHVARMPSADHSGIIVEHKSPLELELKNTFDIEKLPAPQRIPLESVNTDSVMNDYLQTWSENHKISANLYNVLESNKDDVSIAVYRIEQDYSNGSSLWKPVHLTEKEVFLVGSNKNVANNILKIKEKAIGEKGVIMYIVKNYVDLPKDIPQNVKLEDKYSVNLEKLDYEKVPL